MFSQKIKLPRKVVKEEVKRLHMFVWSSVKGSRVGLSRAS